MDILIVPNQQEDHSPLITPNLIEKFKLLHHFLGKNGESTNRYIFHLRDKDDFKSIHSFVNKLQKWNAAELTIVADYDQLSKELIETIKGSNSAQLSLKISGNYLEEFQAEMGTLWDWFKSIELDLNKLTISLKEEGGNIHYLKMNTLIDLGLRPEQILSEAHLPHLNNGKLTEKIQWPDYMKSESFQCEFHDKTLTFNWDGDLLNCPAHSQNESITILEESPENILRYKGWLKKDLASFATCQSCDLACRFSYKGEWENKAISHYNEEGASWNGHMLWVPVGLEKIEQYDISQLDEKELNEKLARFKKSLYDWKEKVDTVHPTLQKAQISIECPVFKSGWIIPAIESVLYQSSLQWSLYLVWDGGDDLSRKILEIIAELKHPKLNVFFSENRGISRARAFLSDKASEPYIMPLDDDDMFHCAAVERYIVAAELKPWFGIIRGRRRFIDETGNLVDMDEWFPFEKRNYSMGMVTDLNNHCQPYLISRKAYNQTSGWEGFPHFHYAGEDCDIYLKAEEFGSVELIEDLLYYYRLNPKRTSHLLKPAGAYEMWRLLVDKSIDRLGLNIKRTNEKPPFKFKKLAQKRGIQEEVDFVIPYYETHEKELPYHYRRPKEGFKSQFYVLNGRSTFQQVVQEDLFPFDRIEVVLSAKKSATGTLVVKIFEEDSNTEVMEGRTELHDFCHYTKTVKVKLNKLKPETDKKLILKIGFIPDRSSYNAIRVLLTNSEDQHLVMRVFRNEKDSGKHLLDSCIRSLKMCGVKDDAIHIVSERQSSSKNRNDGFYRTSKPYVCFLDDDVELIDSDTMPRLFEIMERENADLIGPKLLTNDGLIFCADPYFNKLGRPVPKGLGENAEGTYEYESIVPWLPTTMLLIKREVFLAIGGFDEGYIGSQMEDVDFCLKARRRDFKCIYAGNVSAVHHNHQRNDNFSENFRAFNERWKNYPELWIENELMEEYL
ncbi:MAG: glycosyltransferase involved in cell wall biosynthesis [Crocinitomix sp.]|jgi:glycosyltransferase involved in cell wall biosynthesis